MPGHPLLAFLPDPEPDRSPLQELAVIDVAWLPWPHNPFRCAHRQRFLDLQQHYPKRAEETGVVGAHWTTTLMPADVSGCPYHDVDWARAAQLAVDALQAARDADSATLDNLAGSITAQTNDAKLAEAAISLIRDPIIWSPGQPMVTNGQHRACGLRMAGATRCVVDLGSSEPPKDGPPPAHVAQRAAGAISEYWHQRSQPPPPAPS